MRKLMTTMVLLAGSTGIAFAHTLPDEEGLVMQLDHQVFGLHHLPLTMLVIVAGIWAFRRWRASGKP